ncbi:MAG: PTS sugar transporter subunit IIA, partial [Cetobacterium sp.]
MKLSSYLYPELIAMDLKGDTKEELIKNLIKYVGEKDFKVKERYQEIEEAVLKREREISTAIGHGIAIPHARIDGFDEFIVTIGLVKHPVEAQVAGTAEKDDIQLMILIISDVLKNKNILKVMSAFSKIALRNPKLLQQLKAATTPNELIKLIDEANIELDHKITAEDILSPDIIPAYPKNTLEEIAKRLILETKTGLPVVDEKGSFLGEITERELIQFGMPKYVSILNDLNFLTVGEPFEEYLLKEKIATIEDIYRKKSEIITVDRKTPIMEICFLMVNKGVTRIYVIENGMYRGV